MSAIDDDYSEICARIDTYQHMIHMQNEMLTIWLRRKVYCKLLHVFLHPLQHVEGHDVEKISATFHTINNSVSLKLLECGFESCQ